MKAIDASLLLVATLASLSCEPPPPELAPDAGPESFACELGLPGPDRLSFVPLSEDNNGELQLGFQGLSFVPLRARLASDAPDRVDVLLSARIDGFDPIGASSNGLVTILAADGSRLTPDVQVPANRGTFSQYVGRSAVIDVRIIDAALNATRSCNASGDIVFVDDDECIHTGDVPICPDAGPGGSG